MQSGTPIGQYFAVRNFSKCKNNPPLSIYSTDRHTQELGLYDIGILLLRNLHECKNNPPLSIYSTDNQELGLYDIGILLLRNLHKCKNNPPLSIYSTDRDAPEVGVVSRQLGNVRGHLKQHHLTEPCVSDWTI